MFTDFEEIVKDQINTQGPTLSNRTQDPQVHSSYPFRAYIHGQTCMTSINDHLCPEPPNWRVKKYLYKDLCTQHFPRIAPIQRQDLKGSKQNGLGQTTDERLFHPVYKVQKHASRLCCRLQRNTARYGISIKSSLNSSLSSFYRANERHSCHVESLNCNGSISEDREGPPLKSIYVKDNMIHRIITITYPYTLIEMGKNM